MLEDPGSLPCCAIAYVSGLTVDLYRDASGSVDSRVNHQLQTK